MTKSTLKALWLGGGGLLATWFAVTPSDTPGKAKITVVEPAAIHEVTADNLIAQEARLREHAGGVPLADSTRNPFRFGSQKAADVSPSSGAPPMAAAPASPPPPVQPSLRLFGMAESKTPQGTKRIASISGDGQLYLVTEGEMVAGRYRVITVDSDAVTLRDDAGTELRLAFPRSQ